ncbi:hypothetical protein FRB99_008767, partial [Tulasnella sp. 403]
MTPKLSLTEVATLASRIAEKVCDVPALSVLKPVAGLAVLICEQVSLMRQNKEKGIEIAVRVATLLQVLAENMADDMEQGFSDDVAHLESTLQQIMTGLKRLTKHRQAVWQLLLAQANRESLSRLDASLSDAISLFGVASQITIGKSVARLLPSGDRSNERGMRVDSLTTSTTLHHTRSHWLLTGTYDGVTRKTNVLVKKYLKGRDREFLEDLETHRELTHPNIATLWAVNRQTRIILLAAPDFVYGTPLQNIELIRRLWELQSDLNIRSYRLPSSEGKSAPLVEYHPEAYMETPMLQQSFARETMVVKHSDNIKHQLEDVAEFLSGMQVDVAWWQFDPQWVALSNNHRLVLLDWDSKHLDEPTHLHETEPVP